MIADPQGIAVNREIRFSWDADKRNHVLECGQIIPRPIDEVFEFFGDAFRLEQITPPSLKFRVITPRPIDIGEGTEIDYRLKLRGIPIRWRSLISDWRPPNCFVDQQLRGPYLLWKHRHTFTSIEGGTLCEDRVDYRVPLGRLVNRMFVQSELKHIFSYRQQQLERLLGSSEK